MSEPFVAEIRIFAGNFAIRGWAFCNGQSLPISQNTALFSLLLTNYGGDGESNFHLPNLQGRAPMHQGSGPGLTPRQLGESGGSSTVTLNMNQMPNHNHTMQANASPASTAAPSTTTALARSVGGNAYAPSPDITLTPDALPDAAGGNQPHNNLQPYLTLNFIIALQGVFPSSI